MASHKHGHPAGGSPSDPEFAVGSPRAGRSPVGSPAPHDIDGRARGVVRDFTEAWQAKDIGALSGSSTRTPWRPATAAASAPGPALLEHMVNGRPEKLRPWTAG
ncbi:hypothetical protein ACFZCU_33490 [Streptomyces canus]|uniref:hypothetical protein n=1 Tax=Streptomyces canus TaxID=58343 RepID=UPI0036E4CC95